MTTDATSKTLEKFAELALDAWIGARTDKLCLCALNRLWKGRRPTAFPFRANSKRRP
jgi:hypothetical protein